MTGQSDQRDSDSRQKLLRLMMSALDFRHALSAATFLLEDVDWTKSYRSEELLRFKCYETTMVVSYARPYSQARGHASVAHVAGCVPTIRRPPRAFPSRVMLAWQWSLSPLRAIIIATRYT